MPFFIFFVNKPITFLYYVIGLLACLMIAAALVGFRDIFFPFIFLAITFSMWYPFALFYHYFLKGEDIQIRGISLAFLRKSLKWLFDLHAFAIIVALGFFWHGNLVVPLLLFIYSSFAYLFLLCSSKNSLRRSQAKY